MKQLSIFDFKMETYIENSIKYWSIRLNTFLCSHIFDFCLSVDEIIHFEIWVGREKWNIARCTVTKMMLHQTLLPNLKVEVSTQKLRGIKNNVNVIF